MKILLISSFLPFPLHSGGQVRLYNLIKELSKRHKITLICEIRPHQTKKDIAEVATFCEAVHVVPRRKQWSLKNIARSGYSLYPFLLNGHTLLEMKQKIVEVLRDTRFDLIHIETFYVFQNLPKTYLPTVLVEHNIEYEVYQRFANTAPIVVRPLLMADIWKIKYWEKKFWQKAKEVVAVSEQDKMKMAPFHATVVPNGVDPKQFPFVKKKTGKEKRILFMGDFTWIQNRQAATWILTEIWPKIQEKLSEKPIKLWIVGKHIPDSIKALGGEDVVFDEHAPDETSKIYQKSYVLLAPIKVGGGTSYKILESMASGVPVVTTELGVKGLGAKHKSEALVGESSDELAKSVIELFSDEKVYEKIQKNARALIEEKYTWESITKTLEKVYNNACTEAL